MNEILTGVFLTANTITDVKEKKINTCFCICFSIIGLVLFFLSEEKQTASLLGGIFLGVYLLLFSVLTKQAVGYGDGMVVTVVGILLGGRATVFVLMGGFLLASVFGIIKICRKKAGRKSEMAFLPFLTLSYFLFLAGKEWLEVW